ncbi:DUF222 domain-containing protein, partial [Mycobacterium canetti]|uniref:DUF222 domain-containing protein n=1 Tax=Mycobacterium canetti TaxID=78331 RepID=UPI0005B3A22C
TATATAQRQGLIGEAHIKVIRSFFAHLPAEVDVSTREAAEADLAGKAAQYRPDELARYVTGWTSTGRTDITELTLACGPDNRLAE